MDPSNSSSKALSGIRVLDLTQSESGATVTQVLAWYGADVVKVEEPTGGDPIRSASTEYPGLDSHYFVMLNCNKRSATLDLRSEEGRNLLRRMIPMADILAEDLPPGTMEGLALSYEEVAALNPRLIYARVKGFGSDGPFASFPAWDALAQALGGSTSTTGFPKAPVKPGPALAATGAALHAVTGILAALYQRRRTGLGQQLEVAMQDAVANLSRISYADQQAVGRPAKRVGNNVPQRGPAAPANVYHCKPFGPNDYCYVFSSRAHNKNWVRLLEMIGREDLLGDPRYSTQEARGAHCDEVDRIVGEWTRNYTKHEVTRILGEAGIPVGAVMTTEELSADPYMRRRGMFVTIQHPTRGEMVVPGWPVKMSDHPIDVASAPLLGQHNSEVYLDWLGLGEADLGQLRARGVI